MSALTEDMEDICTEAGDKESFEHGSVFRPRALDHVPSTQTLACLPLSCVTLGQELILSVPQLSHAWAALWRDPRGEELRHPIHSHAADILQFPPTICLVLRTI